MSQSSRDVFATPGSRCFEKTARSSIIRDVEKSSDNSYDIDSRKRMLQSGNCRENEEVYANKTPNNGGNIYRRSLMSSSEHPLKKRSVIYTAPEPENVNEGYQRSNGFTSNQRLSQSTSAQSSNQSDSG